MSEVGVRVKLALVLIWTPADKISLQPRSQACS